MDPAAENVYVSPSESYGLTPAKARIRQDLHQHSATMHALLHSTGQFGNGLSGQMPLLTRPCLGHLHHTGRVPTDEPVLDRVGEHRTDDSLGLTHPGG